MARKTAVIIGLLILCGSVSAERVIIGPFEVSIAQGDVSAQTKAMSAALKWTLGVQLDAIPGVSAFDARAFRSDYKRLDLGDPLKTSVETRKLLSRHTGCRYLLTVSVEPGQGTFTLVAKLTDLSADVEGAKVTGRVRAARFFADAAQLSRKVLTAMKTKPTEEQVSGMLGLLTGSPECVVKLGQASSADNAADRMSLLNSALELDSRSSAAQFLLAQELSRVGKPQRAISAFRRVLSARPDWATPHYDLGNVYFDERRYDEAVVEYLRTLKLDPDFGPAHENLVRALRATSDKPEDLLANYRKQTSDVKDTGLVALNLGRLLHEAGRDREGLAQLQAAAQARPDDAVAAFDLAQILDRTGKLDEARREYLRALELAPNYVKAHNGLGFLYERQGKLNVAVFHYLRATEFNPDYALAFNNLGVAYERKGNLVLAIKAYKRVVELTPTDAVAHFNLAVAWHRSRRYPQAIKTYKKVLGLDPTDALAHFNLAEAYEQAGQPDRALGHYKKVLELNPTDEEAGIAGGRVKTLSAP